MKTTICRWPSLLAVMILTFAGVPPAQAARLRRHAAIPRRVPAVQTETFILARNASISLGANFSASLSELRVGDLITVGYLQENGAWVAHRIFDGVPHKSHNPSTNPVPKAHHQAGTTSALIHVHGVIQGVDIQAGTLTIAHRAR